MAVDIKDVEQVAQELQQKFDDFKAKNDKRVDAIEQEKGKLAGQVETLNGKLSELENLKSDLEKELLELKRPAGGVQNKLATEHKEAFVGFLRKGREDGLRDLERKALQVTEMNDTSGRWSYARQLYGHVYTAKIGTLSELVTAGDQFNQQHITLAGYEKDTQTPADELAASRTARAAVFIRNDPARPTQTGELVGMLPAPKGKRFTMTEQQTLLSHGVATAYVESGVLRIQRDVTTYRKNAYGVADNSYLDSETLHTSAYVLRKLKSVITSKYGRHKLASDGTRFGPGQAIVTPAVIKGELLATYRQLERAGIVENYELFKQYLVVERDASDPNRLNTLFPPDYVNQLRVFAVVNQFRLQYSEESA